MLVDIDIPAKSQVISVMRPDGSITVSVPHTAFREAARVFTEKCDSIARTFAADDLLATVKGEQ